MYEHRALLLTRRLTAVFGKGDRPGSLGAFGSHSRKGAFLPLGEYRWEIDNPCNEVGIEGLTSRGVRHTSASLAINAGAKFNVVQRLLGHATVAVTLDRYGIALT